MSGTSNVILSIIMVNYNHGDFVGRAIDSILRQRVNGVELIVVDGGSSDHSVREIEARRSGIDHLEVGPDSGQSEALNKGIARSTGAFLTWVNADDLMVDGSLPRIVGVLRANPGIDWFAGNTVFIDGDDRILWVAYGMRAVGPVLRSGIAYVGGPSSIFSRRLFEAHGPFDETLSYAMDADLWKKFIRAGHTFHRLDFLVWAFRVHSASKTSHAFSGQPVAAFEREREEIEARQGRRRVQPKRWRYRVLRVASWSAAKSAISTLRYRGVRLRDAEISLGLMGSRAGHAPTRDRR